MKKFILVIAVIALLAMTACTSSNSNSSLNDMELSDIMTALYQGLEEDELPNFGEPVMVTDENVNWYLGLTSCDFAEALASEPMISSIAHSVVLVRLNDGQDAEALETAIQADLNTYRFYSHFNG